DDPFLDNATPLTTHSLPISDYAPGSHARTTLVRRDGKVDARRTAGGFSARAIGPTTIILHWSPIPNAGSYMIYRSTHPFFTLTWDNILTTEADGSFDLTGSGDHTVNHWDDVV